MEEKQFVCIECPRGCMLTATLKDGAAQVRGNMCPRGKKYAEAEMTEPRRVLTSTVRTAYGLVPVKTNGEIKKSEIFDVMKKIRAAYIDRRLDLGDIVIADADGEGVDVISCGRSSD